MIRLPLSRGQFALIDDEDLHLVKDYTYYAHWADNTQSFYARRWNDGRRKFLHQDILGVDPSTFVDHRNMNTLDCRRDNLRVASRTQNGYNRDKPCNNTSGYKGVHWDKEKHLWRASIGMRIDGKRKRIHCGYHVNIEDAARAYAAKAEELAGEFARHAWTE